jgi:hypothetical protein
VILLLRAWVQAQAKLLLIACSSTKALGLLQQWNSGNSWIITTMGSLLRYVGKSSFSSAVGGVWAVGNHGA